MPFGECVCFRNAFELICDLLIFHLSAETMTDGKAVVTELALIFKYPDVC